MIIIFPDISSVHNACNQFLSIQFVQNQKVFRTVDKVKADTEYRNVAERIHGLGCVIEVSHYDQFELRSHPCQHLIRQPQRFQVFVVHIAHCRRFVKLDIYLVVQLGDPFQKRNIEG